MTEEINLLIKTIKCLTDINLNIIKKNKEYISLFLKNNSGLFGDFSKIKENVEHFKSLQPNCIYEIRTLLNIRYTIFYEQNGERYFILGPVLTRAFDKNSAEIELKNLGFEKSKINYFLNLAANLPLLDETRIYNLTLLIIQHFTGSDNVIAHKTIQYPSDIHSKYNWLVSENTVELSTMRKIETRYELSNALTEAVKKGNLSLALHLFSQYNNEVVDTKRNINPLRNIQNYCIVLNTQLRHSLEGSSIHPYKLDRLSSEIAHEIEQLSNINQTKILAVSAIKRYCRLVQENDFGNIKPLTSLAVAYIKEHLNENLTVKDTAKKLTVNANYLSGEFHKDMGVTFIDYVNSERVKQAAALLINTKMQIQQIALSVGYNNTSYFTKQFQKHYKISPRAYRNEAVL